MEAEVLPHILTHENERPENIPNIITKAVGYCEERHVEDIL